MRRMLVVLSLAVVMTMAGVAGSASAVVGGRVDGVAHPYAGTLLSMDSLQPRCSGTLVQSAHHGKVFLTVAHCMGSRPVSGRLVRVTFDPAVSSRSHFLTGLYYADPRYDPQAPDPHDIAVVVLYHQPLLAPEGLAAVGTLGHVASGTSLVTVGYGEPALGTRKSASELTTGGGPVWLDLRAGSGNSCDFDSGGPDLLHIGHGAVVAALTDRGTCSQDQDYRVDTAGAHGFVDGATYRP